MFNQQRLITFKNYHTYLAKFLFGNLKKAQSVTLDFVIFFLYPLSCKNKTCQVVLAAYTKTLFTFQLFLQWHFVADKFIRNFPAQSCKLGWAFRVGFGPNFDKNFVLISGRIRRFANRLS